MGVYGRAAGRRRRGGMGSGRVESLDALYRVVELVVREDGV